MTGGSRDTAAWRESGRKANYEMTLWWLALRQVFAHS